ncbi:MAG TPA: hypothetical protein VMW69_09675 [Spirochaetia bacterium]|nr:hypothetical protein [Spirochaetia bacterium]
MEKRLSWLAAGCLLAATLMVSCQAVFTYSPLKGLQRNPANMSPSQQVAYAQNALASGDPTAMKAAYDAIKSSTDPSTNLLAGELAFGASGATSALTQALADVASGGSLTDVQALLNSVDTSLVAEGAQNIINADNGGVAVSDSQYAIASASLAASAAKQAGGFSNLASLTSSDPGYADLQQAKDLASKITSSDLTSVLQSIY